MRTGLTRAIAVALTFVPTAAFAHAGHGHAHGFIHGFAHPLSGLDHVLVMIAIGIVAWQFVRRAFWLLPATFAISLTLGGILAITHTSTPSDVAYAAGFMAATALLHAAGIALGFGLTNRAALPAGSPRHAVHSWSVISAARPGPKILGKPTERAAAARSQEG